MPVHKHDGTNMGPNPPKHMGPTNVKANEPAGKDAGGTENMEADGKKYRADATPVPEHGSAKFKPAGVRSHGGTSAPHGVATKPASKTKD